MTTLTKVSVGYIIFKYLIMKYQSLLAGIAAFAAHGVKA